MNGLLVPLRDTDAVVNALKILIESSNLRQEMGARGRELVEREFSLEKVNNETLSLYEEIQRE